MGTVFLEIRPGAGLKTGVFVREKLGRLDRRTTPSSTKTKTAQMNTGGGHSRERDP